MVKEISWRDVSLNSVSDDDSLQIMKSKEATKLMWTAQNKKVKNKPQSSQ